MAFLGIKVPHEVARLFRDIEVPGEKVAESEYHITVLCFEDNWPIAEIAKAMEATYEVVKHFTPFHIKTNKVTCFPKREDSPCPIITKVESKDLMKLNTELKAEFDKQKVEYSKLHKNFSPHITLSYAEDEIKDLKIDMIEFFVHEIVLWGGDNGDDRIFITFPLKNSEKEKHSYLIQKAEVFQKLSTKEPNSVFKQSTERRKTKR